MNDQIKLIAICLNISLVLASFVFAVFSKYGTVLLLWGIIGLTTLPFKE